MLLSTLRQRNFALLWLGGLISQTGDWLLIIGLPVYVYTQTGSALATSITLITGYVPGLLFGSLAGVLVDRWDRKWTLIISNLLLAIGLLPLLAVHSKASLWIVYIVLFVESSIEQVVLPAENALLPNLVSKDMLVSANALISVSSNTSRLAGAALGGLLLGLVGLGGVTLLDVLSFLFVSTVIVLINMPTKPPLSRAEEVPNAAAATMKQLVQEWLEGLQLIYRERTLTILLIAYTLTGLGEGIFGVLLVVFVKQVLGGGAVVYGSLLAVQAIGSLIGGLVIGQIGNRIPPLRLVGLGLFAFGFIDLLIIDIPIFVHGLLIVFLLFILVGLPGTASIVGFYASLQTLVEDKLRGRVFGALLAMRSLLTLIGMVLAGTLGDRLGPVLMLNAQGSMYLLSGLLVLLTLWNMIAGKQTSQETESARPVS
jgi:MFS family permease